MRPVPEYPPYGDARPPGTARWLSASALLVLLTSGLACAGLLFNALDAKSQTIWPGWLVHMGANLAINTIALHLWGII